MWNEAETFLKKDKYIAPLIQKWGACKIKPTKKELYFEHLVDAICSQQLSGKAAETIFGRVKVLLGETEPSAVLKADPEDLRKCGLSFAKISYIKDLSQKISEGVVRLDEINKLPDEEIIRELVTVKGIGKWTAEMFLMFSLGRPDIFPLKDLGIKKGYEKIVGKVWNEDKAAKFAEKKWKPYRTVASWYLWRSLEK